MRSGIISNCCVNSKALYMNADLVVTLIGIKPVWAHGGQTFCN